MSYSRMSPMALARSRRMKITEIVDKDGSRWLIEVSDPKFPGKVHTSFTARSLIDRERIKRTYMQQYRIPEQLVEVVVSDTPDTSKEAKNASGDNGAASKLPQPRKAILAFEVVNVDSGAAESSGDVSK